MNHKWITRALVGLFACIVSTLFAPAAHAGPPLVCWPFDIGGAKSLPWSGSGWHDAQPDYDLTRLGVDTVVVLSADASVLTHMETLRRAAIYGAKNPQAAKELLSRLEKRLGAVQSSGESVAAASFDVGYFVEAYRQASRVAHSSAELGTKLNGYELLRCTLAHRSDAEMEFGSALVASAVGQNDAANQYLARAAANAADGSLLAKNLLTHCHLLQIRASTLAELRLQLVAKN